MGLYKCRCIDKKGKLWYFSQMKSVTRRQFIQIGCSAAAVLAIPKLALASAPEKRLSLYHKHTGESLSLTYAHNGEYNQDALRELDHFMRDWRSGAVHPIDPKLFDQLHTLQQLVEQPGPYHVICGYRCPKTNQMLHANSQGVAVHSMHLDGRAIDVSLPGKDVEHLHKAALSMKAGGVGYYLASNFIHLDTGRKRHWG